MARRLRWRQPRDLVTVLAVSVIGAAAYFLFPSDLALLTRITGATLFVLSLALITGVCGIATLGHAVLFGAGAYAAGVSCVRGLTDPLALLAIGAVAGAAAGAVSGSIILRATGLAQLVLSIALVQLSHAVANKASGVTGGSDGLVGISPAPVFGLFKFDLYGRTAYLLGLALLLITLVAAQRVVRSPFGMLCRGIMQDPVRIAAMGVSIYPALIKMYAISGAIAGAGGALVAISTGVVGLDSVSFEWSAAALVMLVLGGASSLNGALIGTVVFMMFEHHVSAASPFHWLIMVGGLLIAVVLFFPDGLQSIPGRVRRLLRGRADGRSA
jgi:branched-chain amino acid transport system permease protein